MENEVSGQVYSEKDLLKAFDMGLEYGICVLENSLGLSAVHQRCIVESYKEIIMHDKVEAAMSSK